MPRGGGHACRRSAELDRCRATPHLAKGFQGLGQLQPSLLMPCALTDHRGKENQTPSTCPQESVWPENMDRDGELPEHIPACDLVTYMTGRAWQGVHSSVEKETRVWRRGTPRLAARTHSWLPLRALSPWRPCEVGTTAALFYREGK